MRQPFISIIITILNGEKTIDACLDSIAAQIFTDYEVVIVDGGSTDHTVEVVKKNRLINKSLYVYPGLGLYAGLNTGIHLSKGKWLYFLGCDDKLHSPHTLQETANIISRSNSNSKVFVGDVNCIKQENLLRAKFGSPYLMRYRVHHQGMFYDRCIFDTYLYNETRRIISDYELNLKLALNKVPHQYMNIIVSDFGGDGISENQAEQGFTEMQLVHYQAFNGITRIWTMNYCSLQYHINLLRRRLNLINLKARFKRLLKIQAKPSYN